MTLWRLEILRVLRTRRWLALTSVYVIFGLLGPITAKYLPDILKAAGGNASGVTFTFPDPVPSDGFVQYVSNAVQIGTIVAVVVAAGALAFDAIPEMGVFLRTRVSDLWSILVPRLVVSFVVASGAFVLGTLTAWYETRTLLGSVPAERVLVGMALGILFLGLVVALVAAVAQWMRGVLATVMTSLVILLVFPIVGVVPAIGAWMPTRLGSALADVAVNGVSGDLWKPTLVAVAAIVGLIWAAGRGASRREV